MSPYVLDLYSSPLSGEEIERRSFAMIDEEIREKGVGCQRFDPAEWSVVRRLLHTTADFSLLEQVRFAPQAISAGIAALRGRCPIFVDSNMIRAGLSLARLRQVNPAYGPADIYCHVGDEDVARQAREQGLPRSLFAVRKAANHLDGALAVFGNAPVALLELNRLIEEEGLRPALVVAMPVGFVHVVESKEELMGLGVPFIAIAGRRGGSPLAVSVVHALCNLALEKSV